jgi:uncharacterized protein (DUF433 family)
MRPSGTAHIVLDDQGRGWIDDTNVKVIEVVLDSKAYRMTAEAIHAQYPHLSLAQIHAALSYYYDHQAEYDAEIVRQEQQYEQLRAANLDSPARRKLRAEGKLP